MPMGKLNRKKAVYAYKKRNKRRGVKKLRKAIAKNKASSWVASVDKQLRLSSNSRYIQVVRRSVGNSLPLTIDTYDPNNSCLYQANSRTFTFDDVKNHSELSVLFDQYRIKAVEMKFIPFGNTINQVVAGQAEALMRIMYKLDDNDSTIPDFATMEESGCKSRMIPARGLTIRFKPKVLTQLYQSAMGTGYATSKSNPWIDANDNPPHYGIKWIVYTPTTQTLPPYTPAHYQFEIRYVLELKGQV